MALERGQILAQYRVLERIGSGGMGEVWRAQDTRLGREVAIKVLLPEVADDPSRLKRFEKEARSASALNHPNIVTIYDFGTTDSVSWMAMELVQGRTLQEILADGALPIKRLLQTAVQITDGLAKAHEAGIVHRDLKPANVMVTKDGLVKILDFGLAKLSQSEVDAAGSFAPTKTHATEPGVILGSVGYMSPEQASAQAMDYRSDQFSFGSVLYEMAAGKRPFEGKTTPEILTAIIRDEPEQIGTVNPQVPVPLRWIVERCIAKDPEERYASTKDLARDLLSVRNHLSDATSGAEPLTVSAPSRRRAWIPTVIAAAVVVALGATVWRLLRPVWQNPLAGARFSRFTSWEGSELDASISSDGKFVAFLADHEGSFDAWVGQVGSGEFLNLTKGRFPALANTFVNNVGFSGDGAHVWFRNDYGDVLIRGNQLPLDTKLYSIWLVTTIGGTPRVFLPNAVEAAWSPDQDRVVYFTPEPGDPIFVADKNGGNARQICVDKPGIHQHYVSWSPDGRFIYFVRGIPDEMDVWRVSPAGGVAERLTHHSSRVAYPRLLDDRTLIYTAMREDGSGSCLYAMDVERRIPHPVTAGLEEYVSVDASGDGQRLVATVANPVRDLWTVPITDHVVDESSVKHFKLQTVRASAPRFGRDCILYLGSKGAADGLWKWEGGSETELWKGSEGGVVSAPAASPDGSQICFVVRSEGRGRLYLMASDGTGARHVAESLEVRGAPSWSHDGKWIAVAGSDDKANPLFKVPLDGGAPVRLVDGVNSVISNPVWSPDGRVILYSEGRGGATVRIQGVTPDKQPFPLPEVLVGATGDRYRFLPDGKSLVVTQGVLWLQNFSLLDLATGKLRPLTHLTQQFVMKSFDVSPDGKQILFDRYRGSSDLVLIDRPPR
ncbi:MAG TPA: protein kinase [Candidatus Krumholzibacteria bacterium]|nr:protein kinase [Candidatus Krumholzibacteria bacterium]